MISKKKELFCGKKNFHFIGIGGIGMSALAKVLHHLGFQISGSDQKESQMVQSLRRVGIPVHLGHENLPNDTGAVVYSTAIRNDNPERCHAEARGVPCYHRSEILAELLNHRNSIGVTGTHGKTTTAALISFLTRELGLNSTCLVGGVLLNHEDNVLLGDDDLYIAEVDESDKSHCRMHPQHSIITNVESEHLEHYNDFEEIKTCFKTYGFQTRAGGHLVLNADDTILTDLFKEYPHSKITYAINQEADFQAIDITLSENNSIYTLRRFGKTLGKVNLSVPGLHNVSNSLAALALLISLGFPVEGMIQALSEFKGTGRRLEVKLKTPKLLVVDDYAHHPTEIRASLDVLKNYGSRVTVIFQPHRFSRTKHLLQDLSTSFGDADQLILTDIYSAGEKNHENFTAQSVLESVRHEGHPNARFVARKDLLKVLEPADPPQNELFVFMGAGDIGELADAFAIRFKS